MTVNANELLIAGGGKVSVAPVGTAAPADTAVALAAAYKDVGYTTEDGVQFTDQPTTEEIRAWQSYYAVRRITTAREGSIAFTMQQMDKTTMALYFGGGTFTQVTAGNFKYDPPVSGDAVYERACIIEFRDGASRIWRIVTPKVSLRESTEITFNKGQNAQLAVTLSIIGSDSGVAFYMLTNDVAADPAAA